MKEQSATPKFGARRRSKSRRGEPSTPVQAITNAAIAHSEDMRHRMIQYSLTMGIRMVCLVLIFVFDGWFKIVPIVGAVVLPWVAVMLANGGADTVHQETVELLDEAPLYAVTDAEFTTDGTDSSSEGILQGEIVPDDADTDVTEPDATGPDETGSDEMGGQGP